MFSSNECPKIYRKSVLHLLGYTANLYLSRCSTDLPYILGHSVCIKHSAKILPGSCSYLDWPQLEFSVKLCKTFSKIAEKKKKVVVMVSRDLSLLVRCVIYPADTDVLGGGWGVDG